MNCYTWNNNTKQNKRKQELNESETHDVTSPSVEELPISVCLCVCVFTVCIQVHVCVYGCTPGSLLNLTSPLALCKHLNGSVLDG